MISSKASFWKPVFSERWRHGGWYVSVGYISGAQGCVSNNYPDRKWRIACHEEAGTFASRTEAAYAERCIALQERLNVIARRCDEAAICMEGTDADDKFTDIRDFALGGERHGS
jgi:hypothetical protein